MADPAIEILATAGVFLAVALLPLVIFLVALWRIGTGSLQNAEATLRLAKANLRSAEALHAIAESIEGPDGKRDVAESLDAISRSLEQSPARTR